MLGLSGLVISDEMRPGFQFYFFAVRLSFVSKLSIAKKDITSIPKPITC